MFISIFPVPHDIGFIRFLVDFFLLVNTFSMKLDKEYLNVFTFKINSIPFRKKLIKDEQ